MSSVPEVKNHFKGFFLFCISRQYSFYKVKNKKNGKGHLWKKMEEFSISRKNYTLSK